MKNELTFNNPIAKTNKLNILPEKIRLQLTYCEENNLPMFMPLREKCYYCNKDAYDKYCEEECANTHLVCCGECSHCYCE